MDVCFYLFVDCLANYCDLLLLLAAEMKCAQGCQSMCTCQIAFSFILSLMTNLLAYLVSFEGRY